MKRLALLLIAFYCSINAAMAQNWFQGFQPSPPVNSDPNANYIILGPYTPPATGSLSNYRLITPVSPIAATDNGATGQYQIKLNTVPIGSGGTNAITQQGALNNLMPVGVHAGDLVKFDGTNWALLARGSANQVLTVNGGATDVAWANTSSSINANANFILNAADATMPNAGALTAGTGISKTFVAGGAATIAVDSTVLTNTSTNTATNKTFTAPTFSWNSGSGVTLQGSTFNVALKWTDPTVSSAGTITFPTTGGTAQNVVLDNITQTLAGTYTFSNAVRFNGSIKGSGGLTLTLPNATDTLVGQTTTDTLSNKTLTAPQITNNNPAMTFLQSAGNYTINAANPTAGRTYSWYDAGGNGDIAIKSGVPSAGSVAYANGSLINFTAPGSSGQPLVSTGTGAPTFNFLGAAGGGTGITTVPAKGSLLVGNAGGTAYANLPVGTDTFVLIADSSQTNGVKWGSGGGGSGTVASSSSGQVPVYTAATTVTGNTAFTYSAGTVTLGTSGVTTGAVTCKSAFDAGTFGNIIITGDTGSQANIQIFGSTSGSCTITVAPVALGATLTLPTVTTTMPTAQPAANGYYLSATTAGVQSYVAPVEQQVTGTISAATIATIAAGAATLIAAPGAGKIIQVIGSTFTYNPGTAYGTASTLSMEYAGGTGLTTVFSSTVVTSTTKTISIVGPMLLASSTSTNPTNSGVFLGGSANPGATGTGTIDYTITYIIVTE